MAGRAAFGYAQKAQAASAYRSLIRSSKSTFHSDPQTYRQFVRRAKELFATKVLNMSYLLGLPPDPNAASSSSTTTTKTTSVWPGRSGELEKSAWMERFDHEIQGVLELSKYLTRNIVQARHSEDGQRLVVRFTDQTEIGDNSTIKNRRSTSACEPSSSCCGGHQADTPSPPPSTSRLSQAALERREKRRLSRLQQQPSSSS
ncbi:hypothetical protein PCANC_21123 [Puccinia coronata f. sp. avenae]|uniref:Mitochondrial zinc maintenance protein 1, mitochondrial n=1 Tax=Puccinia coronata f. sp. avenae TaxID=200324 RepID=A0A2N5SBB9_9BASI|nr:hypothetical protein PCANC_21123 [Puccinia coronata f. sp. avenae]